MSTAESLYYALSAASAMLETAAAEAAGLPFEPVQPNAARIEKLIAEVGELIDELATRYPAIGRLDHPGGRVVWSGPDERAPDLLPSEAYMAQIGALAPSEIEDIDSELLESVGLRFQKIAFIVAGMLVKRKAQRPSLPDVFYSQRVIRLVKLGKLEAQGDLRRMRYSEVRRARG